MDHLVGMPRSEGCPGNAGRGFEVIQTRYYQCQNLLWPSFRHDLGRHAYHIYWELNVTFDGFNF